MALALAGLCLAVLACEQADEHPPPSAVLLLSVDTLRPDYLSFNEYDRDTSPFVDELLRDSWYFEQAMSPIGRTTPALASLLTGSYPHTTGVRTLSHALRDDVITFTEVVRQSGYQTLAVVTNQVLSRNRRLDRGFDHYDVDHAVRHSRATSDAAIAALAQQDPALPSFVWVHWVDPHLPYHPAPEIARDFDPDYDGRFALNFGWQPQAGEPASGYLAYPEDLPKAEAVHENRLPDRTNAHVRRLYAGDIRGMDDDVRRVVEAFRARYPQAIIVFTADHGESLGEHDYFYDHGDYVYGAALRVPLGFSLPTSHPLHGRGRCAGWVSLVDVVPTLLELTEVKAPAAMRNQLEGRSLASCMRGEALSLVPVFAESGKSHFIELVNRRVRNDIPGRIRAVVADGWKLVFTPFAADADAFELYDLATDPDETLNLFRADHPRVPELRRALREWMARRSQSPDGHEPTAADLEALRALGYVE